MNKNRAASKKQEPTETSTKGIVESPEKPCSISPHLDQSSGQTIPAHQQQYMQRFPKKKSQLKKSKSMLRQADLKNIGKCKRYSIAQHKLVGPHVPAPAAPVRLATYPRSLLAFFFLPQVFSASPLLASLKMPFPRFHSRELTQP